MRYHTRLQQRTRNLREDQFNKFNLYLKTHILRNKSILI